MPDTWIGLNSSELKRNWWWTGFPTLLCAGTAVAVVLSGEPDPRGWLGGVGVCWLGAVSYMVNRGYGRTLLTSDGMRFRTFLSHRMVPWSDVVRIEKREHTTRSGMWWDVKAVRSRGRALTVPGAFSHRRDDPHFEQKVATIRAYWRHARAA
ncbi:MULTISPECIES: hypothetical protein [unclassified Streptomyces]|uniref:hypothetical protein n=1 Tax=unclassified Streptomyces TaxID=2593676 RepID=UPI0013A704ED|nr:MULTISPECIES: hypothetical protein [unclassified Streptomyces]QZZ32164.1 hypothetical protein A7X85_43480 [Streptomyces sp. ST1015]